MGAIAGTYKTAGPHKNWLADVLSASGHDADFIALHNSFAPIILNKYDFNKSSKRLDAYLSMFAQARFAGEDTREVMAKFSQAGPRGNPDIAITEHFPLFGAGGSEQQMKNNPGPVPDTRIGFVHRELVPRLHAAEGLDGQLQHHHQQMVWSPDHRYGQWPCSHPDLSRIRSVSKPFRKHTCGLSGFRAFLFHETRGGG